MLDVKGHIIAQNVLRRYSYEQCSNKTHKPYGSWRTMDDFVSIFYVLTEKNCPTDRGFADLAEDFILEMESEFPRNSLKSDEEVWKECAQKAKAFLASPKVQQLLQEEPLAKKQRVASEDCTQKAKAFLASPTVHQLLQEEPCTKKQKVAQEE